MRCPSCKGATSVVRRTQGARGRTLPGELRGLDVLRRRRVCTGCGAKFFTIEMRELEFDALRKPASLVQNVGKLRSGMVMHMTAEQGELLKLIIKAAPARIRDALASVLESSEEEGQDGRDI